jgi:hypothetical protein
MSCVCKSSFSDPKRCAVHSCLYVTEQERCKFDLEKKELMEVFNRRLKGRFKKQCK